MDYSRIISVNNVTKTFGDVVAVSEASFSVEQGQITGFLGPNGAGKSTILKMLMGFIRPTTGRISILGNSPDNPEIKRYIGYLPENPYPDPESAPEHHQ